MVPFQNNLLRLPVHHILNHNLPTPRFREAENRPARDHGEPAGLRHPPAAHRAQAELPVARQAGCEEQRQDVE